MGKRVIRISVRALVEFILRSGDLDGRRGSLADREAMQKGSRIHRKIQRQMGAGYQAEVPLVWERGYEGFTLRLEGRADGIIPAGKEKGEEDVAVIDEIKGVFRDLDYLAEPIEIHLAQAKCYACMYMDRLAPSGKDRRSHKIAVQMTYCNIETEQIRRFRQEYQVEELFQWFEGLIDAYHKWADHQVRWQEARDLSMQGLEFPFAYRPGQRDIVRGVYHTIFNKKQLFVQAPTGVGKTMSALFPAVRAIGEGLGEKLFYLTAKTVTRTVAEEAIALLAERGLRFQALTLTAKEKICPLERPACNPEECIYAKGHFDRVNDAVYEIWTRGEALAREEILDQAERWQVCPYEMSLDLAEWVDGVICDYNHVFDPNARLCRFFGENAKGEHIFLIDEAHNLVDRGREMFSAVLREETVAAAHERFYVYSRKLDRYLERLGGELLALKQECATYRIWKNAGGIPVAVMNVAGELETLLADEERKDIGREAREEMLGFYFVVRDFLAISELVDENYVVYTQQDSDGGFFLKLFCVNPSGNLQACLDKGVSTVFFSATLHPPVYYRSLFSRRHDDYAVCVPSPFDQKRRCLCVARDVSSRYTRRGPEEYQKIASYIYCMVSAKKGNYLVFFPSYQMQQEVFQEFLAAYAPEPVRCICQRAGMDEGERVDFLKGFQVDAGESAKRAESLVGFCVMGGIFSEGIDLIGESLIGVAVVGTGIPQVSYEREILKAYYDQRGGQGFDYAYRYPGMNKVLQAAGRVIRTPEDMGIILLLDDRFLQREYRRLFPAEWADYAVCTRESVGQKLQDFWTRV